MEDETKGRHTTTGRDLNLPTEAITGTAIETITTEDPCPPGIGKIAIIAQTTTKGQIHQTDTRDQNHQGLPIGPVIKPTTEEGHHLHTNRIDQTKTAEQTK